MPSKSIALVFLLFTGVVAAQERRGTEVTTARPYLRWDRPAYHSYALEQYSNYPSHTAPYQDAPRTFNAPWAKS